MRTLTLPQPYASLLAVGAKGIETRSWAPSYRGPLAIHASSRHVHSGKSLLLARMARIAGSISPEQEQEFRARAVPFGAIVATCELVDVVPTNEIVWSDDLDRPWRIIVSRSGADHVDWVMASTSERAFGDFGEGRFAWLLDNVHTFADPVPAKGAGRLWHWEST